MAFKLAVAIRLLTNVSFVFLYRRIPNRLVRMLPAVFRRKLDRLGDGLPPPGEFEEPEDRAGTYILRRGPTLQNLSGWQGCAEYDLGTPFRAGGGGIASAPPPSSATRSGRAATSSRAALGRGGGRAGRGRKTRSQNQREEETIAIVEE